MYIEMVSGPSEKPPFPIPRWKGQHPLLDRTITFGTILLRNAGRAAANIANPRSNALSGTRRRQHRAFALVFIPDIL